MSNRGVAAEVDRLQERTIPMVPFQEEDAVLAEGVHSLKFLIKMKESLIQSLMVA
jgi:hypothetical protein